MWNNQLTGKYYHKNWGWIVKWFPLFLSFICVQETRSQDPPSFTRKRNLKAANGLGENGFWKLCSHPALEIWWDHIVAVLTLFQFLLDMHVETGQLTLISVNL